jgi:hypothetical protein
MSDYVVPGYASSDHTDPSEYDYTAYNTGSSVGPGAGVLTTARSRRSASMSHSLSSGPYTRSSSSYYDPYTSKHAGGGMSNAAVVPGSAPTIKFRAKGSTRSGVTLDEAAGGVKLSGGDYVKWNEINADARGRIHLRIKVRRRALPQGSNLRCTLTRLTKRVALF